MTLLTRLQEHAQLSLALPGAAGAHRQMQRSHALGVSDVQVRALRRACIEDLRAGKQTLGPIYLLGSSSLSPMHVKLLGSFVRYVENGRHSRRPATHTPTPCRIPGPLLHASLSSVPHTYLLVAGQVECEVHGCVARPVLQRQPRAALPQHAQHQAAPGGVGARALQVRGVACMEVRVGAYDGGRYQSKYVKMAESWGGSTHVRTYARTCPLAPGHAEALAGYRTHLSKAPAAFMVHPGAFIPS